MDATWRGRTAEFKKSSPATQLSDDDVAVPEQLDVEGEVFEGLTVDQDLRDVGGDGTWEEEETRVRYFIQEGRKDNLNLTQGCSESFMFNM